MLKKKKNLTAVKEEMYESQFYEGVTVEGLSFITGPLLGCSPCDGPQTRIKTKTRLMKTYVTQKHANQFAAAPPTGTGQEDLQLVCQASVDESNSTSQVLQTQLIISSLLCNGCFVVVCFFFHTTFLNQHSRCRAEPPPPKKRKRSFSPILTLSVL